MPFFCHFFASLTALKTYGNILQHKHSAKYLILHSGDEEKIKLGAE